MSDTPWIKWYSADFLNGSADLSPNEIAIYIVILCRIYDEDGPIPHDVQKIARRCNMRVPQCQKALMTLLDEEKLISDGEFIDNKRAQKEREKRRETSSKQSRNSNKRWQKEGKKANENKDPVIPPQSQTDAKPMPTRSQKPEPEPDKNITTTETLSGDSESGGDLVMEIFEAITTHLGQGNNPNWFQGTLEIERWINSGIDFETAMLVVREVWPEDCGRKPPSTLNYFRDAMDRKLTENRKSQDGAKEIAEANAAVMAKYEQGELH